MEKLRQLFIALFKPTLYRIEKNSLVGDSILSLEYYDVTYDKQIRFAVVDSAELLYFPFKYVYILKSSAQSIINKNNLQYPEKHVKLIREIESAGIVLSSYARTQILEDGEDSQIYQSLVVKDET